MVTEGYEMERQFVAVLQTSENIFIYIFHQLIAFPAFRHYGYDRVFIRNNNG